MLTYRQSLLQFLGQAHDATFDQLLQFVDTRDRFELGNPELPKLKKRASRLSKTLSELEQQVPPGVAPALAQVQPLLRNPALEAVRPQEQTEHGTGPVFASDRDTTLDVRAFAQSAITGWEQYRALGAQQKSEVFFAATSPNQNTGTLATDRGEFGTHSIQLTEILLRMLATSEPEQRTMADTFQRPRQPFSQIMPAWGELADHHFQSDAVYERNGQPIALFLPCTYWWNGLDQFEPYIEWIVAQCQKRQLVFELWQPGLIPQLR